MDLDLRSIKGIGPAMAEKLKSAGITSVAELAVIPARELSELIGISEEHAFKLTQAAREVLGLDFITAEEYYNRRSKLGHISTGCRALDELLGGGIETQAITEFVGEFGTGKTQICHQLAVMVQFPREKGGLSGRAVYIDTEGTFRPERIIQIAKYRGLDPKEALKNIFYARSYNSDHLLLLVDKVFNFAQSENVKLVIIDSLISHFRAEYLGREHLAPRQQKINMLIHKLQRMADIFNIAVVITNQVMAQPDVFFGNPSRPAGGNVVAHGATYRIWLRKAKEMRRIARIFDSPSHPEGEAVFRISDEGIVDV